ncbi:MAG: CaiB/BaiF CoA-transferase family protein [Proteobacteria bacterium]|nr:CaiB/BaiF CoA-transferase family protein [Pseudomonadota bacterium]
MAGPLDGLRVFDLTRVLAGPSCTQILGDLGADVIKVERPGAGDDTRKFGPPFVTDGDGKETTESGYFLSANRNKRSITLDLTSPEGQDLARDLIATCDILVENFKFGNLEKYGLGYEQLHKDNPGLVYCSITGFGHSGPKAERPGYDFLIQGMGGFMSITGEPDGEPQKAGVPIADLMAGMWAAVSINAALRHREVTGKGQHIDIGMLDTMAATLSIQGLNYLTSGVVPERLGNAHPNIVPYQVFSAADGDVVIAVGNDSQFKRFCDFAGVPELAVDDRYKTNDGRVRNRKILIEKLSEVVRSKPSKHWLEGMDEIQVSSGPINRLDQVFEDPQITAREMSIEMDHPLSDKPVKMIGSPIKLSESPVAYRHAPPTLGQHTDEILEELLDLDTAACDALRQKGVI